MRTLTAFALAAGLTGMLSLPARAAHHHNEYWLHHDTSVDDELHGLSKSLDLNKDQESRVRKALDDRQEAFDNMSNQIKQAYDNADNQIRNVLTKDQQGKYDKMVEKRNHEGEERD